MGLSFKLFKKKEFKHLTNQKNTNKPHVKFSNTKVLNIDSYKYLIHKIIDNDIDKLRNAIKFQSVNYNNYTENNILKNKNFILWDSNWFPAAMNIFMNNQEIMIKEKIENEHNSNT